MRIILGSGSPRRREILESLGLSLTVITPDVDESRHVDEPPESYVLRILSEKNFFIAEKTHYYGSRLLITADTIVTIDGLILGKPVSRDDALSMLARLSGRTHCVITGLSLTVVNNGAPEIHTALEHTMVTFRRLDDRGIGRYLDATEYMDKAGAYAIQQNGDMIVQTVAGSMTNVIGFPLRLFYAMLVESGLEHILTPHCGFK